MEIQNRKIPEGEFMAMRQEVLQQWPTGRDVDLTEPQFFRQTDRSEKGAQDAHPAACRCAGA